MPKYLIERELPGAGKLGSGDYRSISQKSNGVIQALGPRIQWIHTYVTDDKLYCVYVAPDEKVIREHARQGGFPVTNVMQIRGMMEPATAE
jgi:hypothetical protein